MFSTTAVALPLKQRAMTGRRLIVVDIENVVGGAVRDGGSARIARREIETAVGVRNTDQVVIGASHISALECGLAWPTARLLMRSGPDGADLCLLEVLMSENIGDRFDEVVLVSGDGIFTGTVALLGASGVRVTVVSWSRALSRELRMAAMDVVCLSESTRELDDAA